MRQIFSFYSVISLETNWDSGACACVEGGVTTIKFIRFRIGLKIDFSFFDIFGSAVFTMTKRAFFY